MFSALRQGWSLYAPVHFKALGTMTVHQLSGLDNNSTEQCKQIPPTKMTKIIPAEVSSVDSCVPSSAEATSPTATHSFISFTPTINGVLDLSPTAPTYLDSDLTISNRSLTTEIQDLSFTIASTLPTTMSSPLLFSLPNTVTSPTATSPNPSAISSMSTPSILNDDEESTMDPTVVQAAHSAALTGLLTPLIKEELRCTIQTKRLNKGEDELVIDHSVSEHDDELTPEDHERRSKRRERNKLAAQRCRNKRKQKADILETETAKLESSNSVLKKQIKELELEKHKLTLLLQCHDTSFHNCPKNTKLSCSEESENYAVLKSGQIANYKQLAVDGFEQPLLELDDSSNEGLTIGQEIEIMDFNVFDENVNSN